MYVKREGNLKFFTKLLVLITTMKLKTFNAIKLIILNKIEQINQK